MQAGLEARHEIAVQHALAVDFQDAAVGRAAQQGLAHVAGIDALAGREFQGFRDPQQGGGNGDLVAGLGHLAGAAAADVDDTVAKHLEQWQHPPVCRLGTPHHDRQGAGLGARLAAGHRRVQQVDAAPRESRGEIAGRGGRGGAHVDHHRVLRQALGRALRAEQHGLQGRVVGDVDEDDGGRLRHPARRHGGMRAGAHQRLGAPDIAGEHGEGMAGAAQVEGHGLAHGAEADESEGRHGEKGKGEERRW